MLHSNDKSVIVHSFEFVKLSDYISSRDIREREARSAAE